MELDDDRADTFDRLRHDALDPVEEAHFRLDRRYDVGIDVLGAGAGPRHARRDPVDTEGRKELGVHAREPERAEQDHKYHQKVGGSAVTREQRDQARDRLRSFNLDPDAGSDLGKRVVAMRSPSAIPPDTTTSCQRGRAAPPGGARAGHRQRRTPCRHPPAPSQADRAAPRYTRSGMRTSTKAPGRSGTRAASCSIRARPAPRRSPHRPRHPPAGLPRGRGSCGCPRATSPRPGGREDPPLRRRDDHNPRRSVEFGCPDAPDPTGAQRGRSTQPLAERRRHTRQVPIEGRDKPACSQDRAGLAPPPPRSARSPLPDARYAPASLQPDVPSPPPPAHARCDAPEHRPTASAPPSPLANRSRRRSSSRSASSSCVRSSTRPASSAPSSVLVSASCARASARDASASVTAARYSNGSISSRSSPARTVPPSRSFRPPPPRGLPPAPAAPRRAAPPPRQRRKWRAERRQSARSLRQSAVPARAAPCARSRPRRLQIADRKHRANQRQQRKHDLQHPKAPAARQRWLLPYSSTLPLAMGGLVPLPSRGDNRGPDERMVMRNVRQPLLFPSR